MMSDAEVKQLLQTNEELRMELAKERKLNEALLQLEEVLHIRFAELALEHLATERSLKALREMANEAAAAVASMERPS